MVLLDTHALIWWLAEPDRLTRRARRVIQTAVRDAGLLASAATVFEISTLVRRERLTLSVPFNTWIAAVQQLPELTLLPVTADVAARAGSFGGETHGDPIDRLIIATAQLAGASLVTADRTIRDLKTVTTVW